MNYGRRVGRQVEMDAENSSGDQNSPKSDKENVFIWKRGEWGRNSIEEKSLSFLNFCMSFPIFLCSLSAYKTLRIFNVIPRLL